MASPRVGGVAFPAVTLALNAGADTGGSKLVFAPGDDNLKLVCTSPASFGGLSSAHAGRVRLAKLKGRLTEADVARFASGLRGALASGALAQLVTKGATFDAGAAAALTDVVRPSLHADARLLPAKGVDRRAGDVAALPREAYAALFRRAGEPAADGAADAAAAPSASLKLKVKLGEAGRAGTLGHAGFLSALRADALVVDGGGGNGGVAVGAPVDQLKARGAVTSADARALGALLHGLPRVDTVKLARYSLGAGEETASALAAALVGALAGSGRAVRVALKSKAAGKGELVVTAETDASALTRLLLAHATVLSPPLGPV